MNRTVLLAKTFFARFFETDLMPPGLPQVQLVIWSMAFLAAPGLLFPMRFAGKYMQLEHRPALLAHALIADRLVFITLTMTAIGLVALVIWDGMFPDRRDARILSALPVPGRTLVGARLLALAALTGVFLAGVNLVPTVVYGAILAGYGGAATVLQGALAHALSTSLAGIFVFSTLMALQGIVLNIGGRRAADRLSLLLQLVFIVALLQMIFFVPRLGAMLPDDLQAPWLRLVPSVWFLGLYDLLGGKAATGAPALAGMALTATAATVATSAGVFIATHGRLTRLALETQDSGRATGRAVIWMLNAVTSRVAPRATARAMFEFTIRTLSRSRSHRLLLSMYVGVALALVASAIVPLVLRSGFAIFTSPSIEILSAPLVVSFFTIVGMRVALAIPVEPRANWIFRIREPIDRRAAIDGVRAVFLLTGVLPTVVLAAASAGGLWGWRRGLAHAATCGLMAWFLSELMLMRLDKMPFTCTYLPGRSRIGTLWPLYLTGMITYCYTITALELRLLPHPASLVKLLLFFAGGIAVLTVRRHHWVTTLAGFRFQEEDPTSLFAGFQLSEGLAAASEDTRRLR